MRIGKKAAWIFFHQRYEAKAFRNLDHEARGLHVLHHPGKPLRRLFRVGHALHHAVVLPSDAAPGPHGVVVEGCRGSWDGTLRCRPEMDQWKDGGALKGGAP